MKIAGIVIGVIMVAYWIWVVVMGIRDQRAGEYDAVITRNLTCCVVNVSLAIICILATAGDAMTPNR